MIRLQQITLREIHLALKEPFRISSGLVTERRIMLLHLRDADGAEVWSECVAGETPNYTAETIDTAWYSICEYVAPRVLGVQFGQPSEVHPALELNFRGHNMAKAAVEMARQIRLRNIGGLVIMDFIAQIQAHLMSHQYESLLKKANFKGGLPTR